MIKKRECHDYHWHQFSAASFHARSAIANTGSKDSNPNSTVVAKQSHFSSQIYNALNDPDFRYSIKDAYLGQSMAVKQEVIMEEEEEDEATGEIVIRTIKKTYTTVDEVKLRGRRPRVSDYDRSASLNYQGRVKQTSKKNAQLEFRFKTDGKTRVVFQHGKFNKDTFILDYGYPFSPVQAFAYALGLHSFSGKLSKQASPSLLSQSSRQTPSGSGSKKKLCLAKTSSMSVTSPELVTLTGQ